MENINIFILYILTPFLIHRFLHHQCIHVHQPLIPIDTIVTKRISSIYCVMYRNQHHSLTCKFILLAGRHLHTLYFKFSDAILVYSGSEIKVWIFSCQSIGLAASRFCRFWNFLASAATKRPKESGVKFLNPCQSHRRGNYLDVSYQGIKSPICTDKLMEKQTSGGSWHHPSVWPVKEYSLPFMYKQNV